MPGRCCRRLGKLKKAMGGLAETVCEWSEGLGGLVQAVCEHRKSRCVCLRCGTMAGRTGDGWCGTVQVQEGRRDISEQLETFPAGFLTDFMGNQKGKL